jgi:hypothetical protein
MLDPTDNQQDCLGMTPLHILTCSSVHSLELYHLIIEKYPSNLITEDRWGRCHCSMHFGELHQLRSYISFLRAIIQFILATYLTETIGRTDTPKECVKQMHFPDQPIDWEYLFGKFAQPSDFSFPSPFSERVKFLVICGMSERVETLAFKVWRDHITNVIHSAEFQYFDSSGNQNQNIISRIKAKVTHFEAELPKLKEVTLILELALWKLRINEKSPEEEATNYQKKIMTDESSIRRQ